MAIQFLKVDFPEERAVLANGNTVGLTGATLMLPPDEYQITLQGGGCEPASQTIVLNGTRIDSPMVITFARAIPQPDTVAAARAPGRPSKRRRG